MTPSLLFSQAYELIRNAERILILTDQRPDGDSIGASSAILNWLLREEKNVRAFCPEHIPHALQFLDGAHRYTNDAKLLDEPFDLVLTFDAPSRADCQADKILTRAGQAIIVFDHHVAREKYGTLNIILTGASSTAEVVHGFFETNGIRVDAAMATSLLAGILYDTTHFSNAGTTVISLEAAGKLVARGARLPDILKNQIRNKSVPGLKLWGLALSRLVFEPQWNLAHTYFRWEDLAGIPNGEELASGMSNFLNLVCRDADTVLVLRETEDGRTVGSLRSLARDVERVAKQLGGGGHVKAAGFTLAEKLNVENNRLRLPDAIAQAVEQALAVKVDKTVKKE